MTTQLPHVGRRTFVAALASLPLACTAGKSEGSPPAKGAASRTLVAYFSRSGNTRVVAGLIHRSRTSALFEIQPAVAYPEDYLETVAQAKQERDSGHEPALMSAIPGIDHYDTVYLGFPIWGQTAPPIIRSLLSRHDMRGKVIVPFVTHGGFGLGSSQRVLASHAPNARILEPFSIEADQERKTMERVNDWLASPNTSG
jgi:flavodoxin